MDIKRLKALSLNDKASVDNFLDFAKEVARTTRKHRLNTPSDRDLADCIGVIADHIGFVPEEADMLSFLWLHPELKSRVIEFGATDTEVRSELHAAVFYFTLRTTDFVEGDTVIEGLVAQQWKRIWQNT